MSMIDDTNSPSQKLIIVVEDDDFLSDAYRVKFAQVGINAVLAKDGELGYSLIKRDHPSLVILDLMLPKLDGFNVLKRMKSDEELKDIPVFIASNFADDEYKKRATELGALDFFVKSEISLKDLITRCHEQMVAQGSH